MRHKICLAPTKESQKLRVRLRREKQPTTTSTTTPDTKSASSSLALHFRLAETLAGKRKKEVLWKRRKMAAKLLAKTSLVSFYFCFKQPLTGISLLKSLSETIHFSQEEKVSPLPPAEFSSSLFHCSASVLLEPLKRISMQLNATQRNSNQLERWPKRERARVTFTVAHPLSKLDEPLSGSSSLLL